MKTEGCEGRNKVTNMKPDTKKENKNADKAKRKKDE
jgi:hypothetical protein